MNENVAQKIAETDRWSQQKKNEFSYKLAKLTEWGIIVNLPANADHAEILESCIQMPLEHRLGGCMSRAYREFARDMMAILKNNPA